MTTADDRPEMSAYERAAWRELQTHWQKKANRRELLPPKARGALETAGRRSREALSNTAAKVTEHSPEPIRRAGGVLLDEALLPTLKAVVHLLELVEDWAAEAMDPETVLQHHREHGRAVEKLTDLHGLDLEPLDTFSRRTSLQWRSFGAVEGAAMGALSFVPVVGSGVAIGADVVVMQLLSTAVASRAMYSYGYDARHPGEREMVERIVRRAYKVQAPKVKAVHDAAKAFDASKNRIRWSQKIRDDHRLMAAVERLMAKLKDGKVPIEDVAKKMPYIGVVTSAGANAYVLGDIAKQGVLYSKTRFLAEKYELPLPANLHEVDDEEDEQNDRAD